MAKILRARGLSQQVCDKEEEERRMGGGWGVRPVRPLRQQGEMSTLVRFAPLLLSPLFLCQGKKYC